MKKLIMIFMALVTMNIYASTAETTENATTQSVESSSNPKPFDVQGNKYIIRPIFGVATTSDLGEILTGGKHEKDPDHGKIAGLQVERYVYKDAFGMPINVTLQGSFILHTNSYDKNGKDAKPEDANYYTNKDSHEVNFGIKIYWTRFPWDRFVRTRFGISEGLSYMDRVTNIERRNQYHENNSNYLNYIDITASFNAKDMTTLNSLEDTYVGIGISHRSGIFGTVNGVDGGSNNITFFFETEL